MDHNMVLSYNYAKQKSQRRRTNAPTLQAMSMAVQKRWSGAWCGIAQCSMSRATQEATGCCHRATTCSVSPRRPRQGDSKQNKDVICTHLGGNFNVVMRRYYTTHGGGSWLSEKPLPLNTAIGRALAPILPNRTRKCRLFWICHCEKGLQLTCWPLITIGVWHIKLMRST